MSDSREMSDLEWLARNVDEWNPREEFCAPNGASLIYRGITGARFAGPSSHVAQNSSALCYSRAQWQAERKRLGLDESPVEWDGEGPPPAGVECDLTLSGCELGKALITYMGAGVFCYRRFRTGGEYTGATHDATFRPLRTKEEFEREELEACIEEVTRGGWTNKILSEHLYMHGYRKQEPQS